MAKMNSKNLQIWWVSKQGLLFQERYAEVNIKMIVDFIHFIKHLQRMKYLKTSFLTGLILQAYCLNSSFPILPAGPRYALWPPWSMMLLLKNALQITAKAHCLWEGFPTWPDQVLSLHALRQPQSFSQKAERPHVFAHHWITRAGHRAWHVVRAQ